MTEKSEGGMISPGTPGWYKRHRDENGIPGVLSDNIVKVLDSTTGQIKKCSDIYKKPASVLFEKNPVYLLDSLPKSALVGCQGVPGAYSHIACRRLFGEPDIKFYEEFEDVFQAIAQGEIQFGVLPVENSSAGAVGEVLSNLYKYKLYTNAAIPVKAEHSLCIHPGTDPSVVKEVISHQQALMQCAGFIKGKGYTPVKFSNTAAAAKKIGEAASNMACLCSSLSAEIYGLRELERGVQDFDENYTRFICVSAQNILFPGSDTISLALSFPNEPGYLNKLLTRFAICNLDLTKLLSMPIASRDFNVRFFLDFTGRIDDYMVAGLLSSLYEELDEFLFLGNFPAYTTDFLY